MDKVICLECGGFYPSYEVVNTTCVYCSSFAIIEKSPTESDVLYEPDKSQANEFSSEPAE